MLFYAVSVTFGEERECAHAHMCTLFVCLFIESALFSLCSTCFLLLFVDPLVCIMLGSSCNISLEYIIYFFVSWLCRIMFFVSNLLVNYRNSSTGCKRGFDLTH
jgi:hypothetical protein